MIVLINPMALPPELEVRRQTYARSVYLKKSGFDHRVVIASYLHDFKRQISSEEQRKLREEYPEYTVIKTPSYRENIGFRRMWSYLVFVVKVLFLRIEGKVNTVSVVSFIPFSFFLIGLKLKWRCRLFLEVLDLWPEGFVSLGIITRNSILARTLYLFEFLSYKCYDRLIFSMPNYNAYFADITQKTNRDYSQFKEKSIWISNGIDLKEFDFLTGASNERRIHSVTRFVYVGSLEAANDLSMLLQGFLSLVEYNQQVELTIYGKGSKRLEYENYVRKEPLLAKRVFFEKEFTPYHELPRLLMGYDISVLHYARNNVFDYGGSQSKLFLYLALGKPIVSNVQMPNDLIKQHCLGVSGLYNSPEEYALALNKAVKMQRVRSEQISRQSREVVMAFDYEVLTKKFIDELYQNGNS